MTSPDADPVTPMIDITDETLVVATASQVRAALCDELHWEALFPGTRLSCIDDRGLLGKRWSVAGALRGSAEVWLEPWADSVVVHVFWQVDPTEQPSARGLERLRRRYALAVKRHVLAAKDRLEAGRVPGTPRQDAAAPGQRSG